MTAIFNEDYKIDYLCVCLCIYYIIYFMVLIGLLAWIAVTTIILILMIFKRWLMQVLAKCRCGCLAPTHTTTPQAAQTTPTATLQAAQTTPAATSQAAQTTPVTTPQATELALVTTPQSVQTTPATPFQTAQTVTPGSTKPLISFEDEGSVSTRTRSKTRAAKRLSL